MFSQMFLLMNRKLFYFHKHRLLYKARGSHKNETYDSFPNIEVVMILIQQKQTNSWKQLFTLPLMKPVPQIKLHDIQQTKFSPSETINWREHIYKFILRTSEWHKIV